MAVDFEKIKKLKRAAKQRNAQKYKDTYKDIAGKGTIVTQDDNNKALYAGELDEVTVRPSNYDKGERFGKEVINSTNETGKQMAPILGGMMIAPFAIGAAAASTPAIGSYLSNPVITNSLNASKNFGRIVNGIAGSNGMSQTLGEISRAALGGMAIDTGYELATGKPAQLGEALDVKNPVLRFGANMVSPGMFAGAGIGNQNIIGTPIKEAGKVAKKGIKTYGTKIFNLTEDITPKWSEKFHTWNAKDNINNMTAEQVINNKKSRLKENLPNYLEDWTDVKNDYPNKQDADFILYHFYPSKKDRLTKINSSPEEPPLSEIVQQIQKFPENKDLSLKELANRIRDINYSYTNKKTMHIGDLEKNDAGHYVIAKPFKKGTVGAHEWDHFVGFPSKEEYEKLLKFVRMESGDSNSYLNNPDNHGTEIKARLGQFKDLFRLKRKQKISKSQLKTAMNLYRNPWKYGLPDNLGEDGDYFIDRIIGNNNEDIKTLRDFMNTTSLKYGGKLRTNN